MKKEQAFWSSINQSVEQFGPASDAQYQWLLKQLSASSPKKIIDFESTLWTIRALCQTFPLLMANFIMTGHVDQDVFDDFCLWLISHGDAVFYEALENPDIIGEWCELTNPLDEASGESLGYIAEEAYAIVTDKDDFEDRIIIPEMPEINTNWPTIDAQYKNIMPLLFEKYWDIAH